MKCFRWILAGALTLGLAGLLAVSVHSQQGQQMLQHGFEGRDTIWQPGPFDAAYKETGHRLTDETAHSGLKSELIQVQAEKGTFLESKLELTLAQDTRDSLFLTRTGHKIEVGGGMVGDWLGGDVDVYTLHAAGSQYFHALAAADGHDRERRRGIVAEFQPEALVRSVLEIECRDRSRRLARAERERRDGRCI